ncbi:MAG: hypothetical protein VX052_00645, partial [Candidatus Thermoplasmatota archaeon]|nr:hypothetical protein [Candidatus Thermoplasmatota archaeon]
MVLQEEETVIINPNDTNGLISIEYGLESRCTRNDCSAKMVEVGFVVGESFDPFKQRCNHGVDGLMKVIKGNIKSQTVNPAPTILLRARVQTNAQRHSVAITPTERLKQDA